MGRRFERDGIVAIMIARNVPFAPFQLINIVGGLAKIRFSDYLIGTILGMAPTILALTILGDRLRGAWDSPTLANVALLLLAIMMWFAIALGLQALSNRWVASRGGRPDAASAKQAGSAAGSSSLAGGAAEAAGEQGACHGQQDGNSLHPG
jgi:membrane protein DedA with SNARE-associated domain